MSREKFRTCNRVRNFKISISWGTILAQLSAENDANLDEIRRVNAELLSIGKQIKAAESSGQTDLVKELEEQGRFLNNY